VENSSWHFSPAVRVVEESPTLCRIYNIKSVRSGFRSLVLSFSDHDRILLSRADHEHEQERDYET